MKTYAWIRATAISKMVNKRRIINVSIATEGLIAKRFNTALPIKWINRCPAVILAVSRIARAIGWISRLIVSIMISIGIRGRGVPWGRKWASEFFSFSRNPIITAPAHRGIAIPKFIESCVVGVNEWGRRPKMLDEAINIIKDINSRAQVWPLGLWLFIICLVVFLIIHCCRIIIRLLKSRVCLINRRLGNIVIRMATGIPNSVGVIKGVNKFSFIYVLKV